MMNAPTIAEKRPVFQLVSAMNKGKRRSGHTNTSKDAASSVQPPAARLSYFSASFIYSVHIFFFSVSLCAVGRDASVIRACDVCYSRTYRHLVENSRWIQITL